LNEFYHRPPCRQKEPNQQIDDLDNPKEVNNTVNKVDNKKTIYIQKRPISTTHLIRPPSRHKTPPKAVGLLLPNESYNTLNYKAIDEIIEDKIRVRPNSCKIMKKSDVNKEQIIPVKMNSWLDQNKQKNICKTEIDDNNNDFQQINSPFKNYNDDDTNYFGYDNSNLNSKKFSKTKYNTNFINPEKEDCVEKKFFKTNYDMKFFKNEDKIRKRFEDMSKLTRNTKKKDSLAFKSSLGSDFLNLFANK